VDFEIDFSGRPIKALPSKGRAGLTTPLAFIYIADVLFPRRPLSETLT